jgi:hypothetical protein
MHLGNICKYSGHDFGGNDENGTKTMQFAGSKDCLSIILAAEYSRRGPDDSSTAAKPATEGINQPSPDRTPT